MAMTTDEVNVSLFDEAKRLQRENAALRKGIIAVAELIAESDGAAGLHMNGDVAPWPTLLEGGHFESWLLDFSIARNIALDSN